MKFKVRDGFVVNRVDVVTLGNGDVVQRTTNAYAGEPLDLTAEQATEHLHQLEPLDKEARAFVESKFVPSFSPVQAAGVDVQALIAEGIKQGMAAILAAQQAAATPAADPVEAAPSGT